jgi:hypothetical protein
VEDGAWRTIAIDPPVRATRLPHECRFDFWLGCRRQSRHGKPAILRPMLSAPQSLQQKPMTLDSSCPIFIINATKKQY